MEQEKLILRLLERTDFVLRQLPTIEKWIDNITRTIDLDELSPQMRLRMYNRLMDFHNNSSDLVRKTFIYFPPSPQSTKLIQGFAKLNPEEQRDIMSVITNLVKQKEEQGAKEDG